MTIAEAAIQLFQMHGGLFSVGIRFLYKKLNKFNKLTEVHRIEAIRARAQKSAWNRVCTKLFPQTYPQLWWKTVASKSAVSGHPAMHWNHIKVTDL